MISAIWFYLYDAWLIVLLILLTIKKALNPNKNKGFYCFNRQNLHQNRQNLH